MENAKIFNTVKGKIGEEIALEYILKVKKFKLLKYNYSSMLGQIDIIAKQKNEIVFIEVKYSSSAKFGRPAERVDRRKIEKIKKVATFYLKCNRLLNNQIRFDVLEILGDQINYIENAF